jgi:uncharacterized protein (TIGR03435 family)
MGKTCDKAVTMSRYVADREEQLGLKLEARQAPVEVLVIDSVELPTPD